MKGWFVTGTDTGIGKTWITLGLIVALQARHRTVAGMKPVASGCVRTSDGLRNEDAEQIRALCDPAIPYKVINPCAYEPPVSPHAAAAEAGIAVDLVMIRQCYEDLAGRADVVVVEGVGGWRVPLGGSLAVTDLARCLDLPVILVVGLRLGCINHAMLSAEAILGDGLQIAAWVANELSPDYPAMHATLDYLRAAIPAPLLGHVPHQHACDPKLIASYLALEHLAA